MEKINHQLADKFWDTHFPELADIVLTECQALDSDFWGKLQIALENSDRDTTYAVLLSNLAMRVETSEMYSRIKRITKRVWDKKTDE